MLKFNFLPKFSLAIVFAFVLFTVIGTLSHEYGHILVAKYFDYDTKLNYGSMYYYHNGYLKSEEYKTHKIYNSLYGYAKSYNDLPKEVKIKYELLFKAIENKFPSNETHSILIKIGGPAQTILTCVIGLFILYYRKSSSKSMFKIVDWLGVFLGLFILREVFNCVVAFGMLLYKGKQDFIGDEFVISRYFFENQWILPIITLSLGLVVTIYLIFKVIPEKFRFSFIVSGLVGGLLGFAIWFGFLGELNFNIF